MQVILLAFLQLGIVHAPRATPVSLKDTDFGFVGVFVLIKSANLMTNLKVIRGRYHHRLNRKLLLHFGGRQLIQRRGIALDQALQYVLLVLVSIADLLVVIWLHLLMTLQHNNFLLIRIQIDILVARRVE